MNASVTPFRTAFTSFLLVSFLGQSIAFAAPADTSIAVVTPQAMFAVHAPLATAKSTKQAMVVIQIAESRPFSTYFEKGGTAEEIARLNSDMKALAQANQFGGLADDLEKFLPWWDVNQTSILLSRNKMKSDNLESFFTQVFIKFKVDETQAQRDPNAFIQWLNNKVTSPILRTVSWTAFSIVLGTFTFTLGLVKGAMVAGPAAGAIGALVEPIIRPIREKAAIIGSRLLGSAGVRLTNKLFKEDGPKVETDLNNMQADVKAARESAGEARKLLNTMGYDLTPAQYAANMNKLHSIWNETNRVWVQTNPSLFKDGRSVFQDATAGRPQSYAIQIMASLQGAELARQGVEQAIDRIIQRTGGNAQQIEQTVVQLLRSVEIKENAGEANREAAQADLTKSKDALKALGATDYQVERITELRLSELVNVRHTAYSLASNVINEIQYEEYNRALPAEVQKIQKTLRDGMCLDYFHNIYKEQVTKIMNEMDFKLQSAERVIETAQKSPELKAVSTASKDEKSAAPVAASKPAAAPRPGVRDFIREKATRATNALSRLNRLRPNAVVIERTGDLKTEKAGTATDEARVETARRVVGHK